jgi:hypothetical protein
MFEEFDTKTNQKENSEHIEQELQIMLENLMKDENEASSTSTIRIGDKNPFVRLNERHHTVKNPLTNLGDGPNRQILFSRTGQKAHPCVRTDKRFPTQKIIQSNMFNFPNNNEYNSHGENSLNNPSRNQSSKSLKIRPIDINIKKANYDQVQKNSFPQFISENLYFSFKGKFCYLIRNYNGSLLLQNSMGNTSYDIICNIFTEIKNEIPTLISDTYGNYFCQKLYLLLHEDQKFIFLNIVKNSILEISCNHVGNYPLQNIIENLKTDVEQNIIVDALKIENVLVRMIDDSNAIHIVEKIIANFDEEKISFVYDYIINNFLKLAVLQNGLGPAKKIILNSKNSSTKLRIQKILVKNFSYLIHDLYGNFTIQSALEVKYLNIIIGLGSIFNISYYTIIFWKLCKFISLKIFFQCCGKML